MASSVESNFCLAQCVVTARTKTLIYFRWIEKETNGTVKEIVNDEPGSDTRLVVASFINLQPKWLYPFDPLKTSQKGLFYLPGGKRQVKQNFEVFKSKTHILE